MEAHHSQEEIIEDEIIDIDEQVEHIAPSPAPPIEQETAEKLAPKVDARFLLLALLQKARM